MSRVINKEEFKASMMAAAESNEESEMIEITEKPRKKPGPKPKKKADEEKATKEETLKNESELVAAAHKKSKAKEDAIMAEAVNEALAKSNRQAEALRAAIQIMIDYKGKLASKAYKLADMAEIYSGYIDTLEEMAE